MLTIFITKKKSCDYKCLQRCFSNNYFIIAFFVASFLYSQNPQKPNVIVIYTDDQGAIDLGSYGSKDIYTPNLDKLAKEGTRFTQAYVAAPVCAPSRAALLTGKYPQNAGVSSNTSATLGTHGLPNSQYTLGELFKDNGYATAHIGKWHLGMSKESSPNAQGFDYSFGHLRGCIDNYSHYFYWEGPNIHDLYENGKEVFYDGQYFPDLASNKALSFVEEHKNTSFFMYYAINMPHYPYQPTQKWRNYYKDVPKPRGDYGAFISTIDERIGFLLNKLEALGIRDNTIIIYQSDNGYSTEIRAFGGGGDSGPYRGAKSSLFEGGIRLPTIISWKNNLPDEVVNNQFLVNIDWMPTLVDLCELKIKPTKIDGISMSKMIQNPNSPSTRKSAFWKYGNQWAVRKGKWKLIGYPKDTSHKGVLDLENDALFLSDLSVDVTEMKNLADQYPVIVEELIADFIAWEHGSENEVPKKQQEITHLGRNKKIIVTKKLHPKYMNINTLLDGRRGYTDYSTGQWIGQEGEELEFIIDLETIQSISALSIGYLHSPSNWIYSPQLVKVSISNDGHSYSNTKQIIGSLIISKKKSFTDLLTVGINQKCRFIKININGIEKIPKENPGTGNPGWFFIDEIIIK